MDVVSSVIEYPAADLKNNFDFESDHDEDIFEENRKVEISIASLRINFTASKLLKNRFSYDYSRLSQSGY